MALAFLGMNGVWVEATKTALVKLTARVSKAEVSVFFATHSEPWD